MIITQKNKARNHCSIIFHKTIGLLSASLFFENACTLLPAGVVLVLEPLIAVIKRVEGSQGGGHFFPECFQLHAAAHLHFPKPDVHSINIAIY